MSIRVDDEHVLALVEAVHGADLDAVHVFAANATLVDDVGQLDVSSAGELIHGARGLMPKNSSQYRRNDRSDTPIAIQRSGRPISSAPTLEVGAEGVAKSRFRVDRRRCR